MTLIVGVGAYFLYPSNILSTPFSNLTLGAILRFLLTILLSILGIAIFIAGISVARQDNQYWKDVKDADLMNNGK